VVEADPGQGDVTARDQILARIRTALGAAAGPVDVPRDYRSGGTHPAGHPLLVDLLAERLIDYRAHVHRTGDAGVAETVAGILGGSRVVVPPALPPAWIPATTQAIPDEGLSNAELEAADAVLTAASVAVAETGTVVLDGSPDQGRRVISLLPDVHVCVLRAAQIVETVPEALARLTPDRPQTWISGPSATSDIELNRVEGVHGPRTLHVVIVAVADGDGDDAA
jgi:L-lactate dehydrogenase complex protein LldG